MKTKMRSFGALLPLSFFLLATGCGAADGDGSTGSSVSQDELLLAGTKWPNGIVPVCFVTASTQRADFAQRKRQIRDTVNRSWAATANVEFTGWGTCPANANGMARITLMDSGTSSSGFGWSSTSPTDVFLNVTDRFPGVLVTHEFGHTLGFAHEFDRADFVNTQVNGVPCNASGVNSTGDTLGTAPDANSLLASTYCGTWSELSGWDTEGVINAYGPRVNAVRPLITGYGSAQSDHVTVSTSTGRAEVKGSGYGWAYTNGWVFAGQIPGTTPLKLYWSPGRVDNATLASSTTQSDVVAAGYTFVRTEGYVFTSQQPGTVPLKQYFHDGRLDHMLTTPGPSEDAAVAAGYRFVRIEGYVPATRPYSVLWSYWNGTRLDNATTKQASQLATDLNAASYDFVGFDGAVWRFAYPSTARVDNYWSSARADHFLLATTASRNAAVAAGYTAVSNEDASGPETGELSNGAGYVHTASASGLAAMNSYWHGGRTEHYTTINKGSVATSQGYTPVQTEGWGLATND